VANPKPIYGVDINIFPGLTAMDWLRSHAKARFACFYLGPTDNHGDTSWMTQRAALAVRGWGFVPTYLGQQAHVKQSGVMVPNPLLGADRGRADGDQACNYMKTAGFALGSIVYLDLEEGDPPNGAYQAYILAWIDAVKARSFTPALYCPGGASRWAIRYARIVWLAAPENLDSAGKAISSVLDPNNLPGPSTGRQGFIATQFLWEIEFQGLDKPADGNHGPRFDLNTGLVADPSDFASVDRALLDLAEAAEGVTIDWAALSAKTALDRFSKSQELEPATAAITAATAGPTPSSSPTSDPYCGPPSDATDRIMSNDKVALDLAEAALVAGWRSDRIDTGLSEDDFNEMASADLPSAGLAPEAAAPVPFAQVKWPDKDANSPDYVHLASSLTLPLPANGVAQAGEFQMTPDDIELVLAANKMNPVGYDDVVAVAIRGARLGRLGDAAPPLDVEDTATTWITETRPDHRHFRCLIGFYTRASSAAGRRFSLFTASTVPNAKYVENWYLYANGRTGSGIGNMMPTGCYVYRIGVHRSPHAGAINPALRLTDSSNLHVDGTATVIRSRNDESYGVDDVWCKTVPADNVHCSFQTETVAGWGAPFSSAGCLTIRGKPQPTDQWKKAQAIMNRQGQGKRCDLTLVTGRDLAIAARLRINDEAGDAAIVRRELGRLRPGSRGDEVRRLQGRLNLEVTGYFGSILKKALVEEQSHRNVRVDGIYSPALDQSWGWGVFT
jgi:hypothetical protein